MAEKEKNWDEVFKPAKVTVPSVRGGTANTGREGQNARAFATGVLYDFPTALAGLPGDIGRLTQLPKSGPVPSISDVLAMLPSSSDVGQFASRVTGFQPKPYEQMTTEEKYARTMGSFLPNVLTSPQKTLVSAAGKVAPKVIPAVEQVVRRGANVIAPAVASEAAGQAFEGEGLEPVARIAGAVLGGRIAAGRPTPATAAKNVGVPLPVLGEQTNAAYSNLRNAGIVYNQKTFVNALDDAASKMKREGVVSDSISKLIGNLKGIGRNELDWTALDAIRKNVSKTAYGANTADADQLAARIVLKAINDLETSPNFYMKPGAKKLSPDEISSMTKEARELAARRIKTRQIEDIIELAPTYGGTPEANIRTQFRRLLRDIKKNENTGWTKDEIAAIEDVANGRQIVQALSKLSPSTREAFLGAPTAGTAALTAGFATGNPYAALAPMAVGLPARAISGARTQEAARRAGALVSAPRNVQEEAISAAERARRGIGQRAMLLPPSLIGSGLLDEDRR